MIRMTDNYNLDTSNWRGRVLLAKIYGYGGYNYFYFGVNTFIFNNIYTL